MFRHIVFLPLALAPLLCAPGSLRAGTDKPKDFPKGAAKAVDAVRAAFPKADIDEATEPKGFGGSGGKGVPLYWTVRFHTGDKKQELSVTPEGVIIRLPIPIEAKDLPKAVAAALAKAAPGETSKSAQKNEMRATMKYVALDKANVQRYAIDVTKDGKITRFIVSPDGKSAKTTEIRPEKKADKPAKELDIPEKAGKAVAAIKALYPDAIVKQITHEVFDGGTGDLEILTYEIEFVTKRIEREMVASPEGVIPHLWAAVKAKDLPKAVTKALDEAAPGAKLASARAFEIRAALRFGAVETPKVYYTVQVEKDGVTRTLKFKADGAAIKEFKLGGKS
ncbi:MAG: hypothetical protein U0793_20245 [Gemmataceae bacterium]